MQKFQCAGIMPVTQFKLQRAGTACAVRASHLADGRDIVVDVLDPSETLTATGVTNMVRSYSPRTRELR